VFNILLQILDDGRLTDGKGRTVDFKNAIVIMTSNIGGRHLQGLDPGDRKEALRLVDEELKARFRPEFLNRVDDIVIFNPLGRDAIERIVEIQMGRLEATLADRRIRLQLTPAARQHLAAAGFDPAYGARPLKRAIQREVQNPLAMRILQGEFQPGDAVEVDAGSGSDGLVFRKIDAPLAEAAATEEAAAGK